VCRFERRVDYFLQFLDSVIVPNVVSKTRHVRFEKLQKVGSLSLPHRCCEGTSGGLRMHSFEEENAGRKFTDTIPEAGVRQFIAVNRGR
jgi:hypothetical protein